MSDLKALIAREIAHASGKQRIRGTVTSVPAFLPYDAVGLTAPTPVCNVDIGEGVLLVDVPIKVGPARSRSYARPGLPVFLERGAQGRYQVVSPADQITKPGEIIDIDEETTGQAEDGGQQGLTIVRQNYDFYKGTTPESFFDPALDLGVLVWLRTWERSAGLPASIAVASDVDGAAVASIAAQAPTTLSVASTVNAPVYRKFDAGLPVTTLSTVDWDGTNDGMDFSANVVESTPGALSIFILLNKDALGSSNDTALELANFRVLSRILAGDRWGIDVGAGVEDSGSPVSSTYTLLEVIATSYSNISLYQDGTFLATITTAAVGLGLGASSLGYSAAVATGSHDGRMAEVLVLDRTVSQSERIAIEAYFNQLAFVAYSRYNDGVTGYPFIQVLDAEGNEV